MNNLIYNNISEIENLFSNKKVAIFDLDGTIADTESLHWEAYNELLKPYGVTLQKEHIQKYIGHSEVQIYKMIQEDFNMHFDEEKFFEDRINKFLELVQKRDLKPFPFIVEFLKEHKDSLSFMLVTSQIPTVVNNLLSFWNFDEYFPSQYRFFCHDGVYKKPEIYRNVAKYIGIESITPDEVILFEDSPHYIQEARKLGISVVGIKHRYNTSTLTSCDAILTSETQNKKSGMNIMYRQIKQEDKEHVNDLYMKLLNNHGSNVGMGYRISRMGL